MGPITLHSGCLGWLTVDQLGAVAAEIGFTAVELTLVPGGHVDALRAAVDLRRAVRTLRLAGLAVPSVATTVADPDDEAARALLTAVAAAGIPRYRLCGTGWPESREAIRALGGLATLNGELGLLGCVARPSDATVAGELVADAVDASGEAAGVDGKRLGWWIDARDVVFGLADARPAAAPHGGAGRRATRSEAPRRGPGRRETRDEAPDEADARPADRLPDAVSVVVTGDDAPIEDLLAGLASRGFDGPIVIRPRSPLAGPDAEAAGLAGRELAGSPGSVAGAPRDELTRLAAKVVRRELERARGVGGLR